MVTAPGDGAASRPHLADTFHSPATGLIYPIWAMVVTFVSVTAVFANSMRGKWLDMFATMRGLVVQQVRKHPATA